MDVSKPFLDKVWIGTSKEYGWFIPVEYEGNHAYCAYCGLFGHTVGFCSKKRQDQSKAIATENNNTQLTHTAKPNTKHGRKEKWIAKKIELHNTQQQKDERQPLE